jgi:hypothetical protein
LIEFIRLVALVITLMRSAPHLPPDLSKIAARSRRDNAAAFFTGEVQGYIPCASTIKAFGINDLEN